MSATNGDRVSPRRLVWLGVLLAGTAVVSAFVLSFASLRELAVAWGVAEDVAGFWPVAVDCAMTAATFLFFARRGGGWSAMWWPLFLLALFSFFSIVGNVWHLGLVGEDHGRPFDGVNVIGAIFVGGVPPVALLFTVELAVSLLSPPRRTDTATEAMAASADMSRAVAMTEAAIDMAVRPSMTAPPATVTETPVTTDTAAAPVVTPATAESSVRSREAVTVAEPLAGEAPSVQPSAATATETTTVPSANTIAENANAMAVGEYSPVSVSGHAIEAPAVASEVSDPVTVEETALVRPIDVAAVIAESSAVMTATEPDTVPLVSETVSTSPRLHAVESVPVDVPGRVAWIAELARRGEDVSANSLADRIGVSERTARRYLADAAARHPEAFEAAA